MSERRRFDPGVPGGVETAYLSLPFESTSCEDWYGFGDEKCPNRYKETGNLETDIASLKKWVGLYGGHGRTWWKATNQDLLEKKQAELSIVTQERLERQQEIDPSTQSSFTPFGDLSLAQLVMDYFPLQEASAEPEFKVVTPGKLTWYYVKKPSGVCERLNVSQNFVDRMTAQGWIFSLTDICATPTSTTIHVSPPEETRCYMVHGKKLELSQQAVGYYINLGVTVTPCEAITDEIPPPSQIPPIEEQPVTTDHVDPPFPQDMPVDDEPITVTPTEPGQVNWIPEPFFSFINNVFRR